jgi:hypothetical protein
VATIGALFCGNSSAGRARPCQGRGREFESRFPLQNLEAPVFPGFLYFERVKKVNLVSLAEWQSGYAAVCKTVYLGSIPGSASNIYCLRCNIALSPGGGIGRRKGLKIPRL